MNSLLRGPTQSHPDVARPLRGDDGVFVRGMSMAAVTADLFRSRVSGRHREVGTKAYTIGQRDVEPLADSHCLVDAGLAHIPDDRSMDDESSPLARLGRNPVRWDDIEAASGVPSQSRVTRI